MGCNICDCYYPPESKWSIFFGRHKWTALWGIFGAGSVWAIFSYWRKCIDYRHRLCVMKEELKAIKRENACLKERLSTLHNGSTCAENETGKASLSRKVCGALRDLRALENQTSCRVTKLHDQVEELRHVVTTLKKERDCLKEKLKAVPDSCPRLSTT